MLISKVDNLGFTVVFMLLILGSSTAQAQSACTGLSSSQCSKKSDCLWVEGYTRKDNRKVKGYCRAKGGKGATKGTGKKDKVSTSSGSTRKSKPADKAVTKKTSSTKQKADPKASAKKSSKKKSTKGIKRDSKKANDTEGKNTKSQQSKK